jgi:hypothetical protein
MREVSSVAAVYYMPEDYEDATAPTEAHHLTCTNAHVFWVLTRSGQITPRFQIHLNIETRFPLAEDGTSSLRMATVRVSVCVSFNLHEKRRPIGEEQLGAGGGQQRGGRGVWDLRGGGFAYLLIPLIWSRSRSRQEKKEKEKSGVQGRAKNMGRKTEDRVSPNRKTAKKEGKKNALKKKQLRLVQPEKSHSNHNTAFRAYCLWA